MKIDYYVRQTLRDCVREVNLFMERNKKYASDDDIFENTEKMAEIARILDIDVRNFADVEWFYLIGKLVRQRRYPQNDNILDAVNYLRRIKFAEKEK